MKNKAFYRKIYDDLFEQISSSVYKGGDFLPSERELCEKYNVERITIRKALDMLVESGYVEKKAGVGTMVKSIDPAQQLQGSTKNVLFLLPKSKTQSNRISDIFNESMFFRLEREFRKLGYTLIYASVDENDTLDTVANGNYICGIIVTSTVGNGIFSDCKRMNLPVIVMNNFHEDYISIYPDNVQGINNAITYLYELGHRKIGFILGEKDYFSTNQRYEGYITAHRRLGLDLDEHLIAEGHWNFPGGYAAMEKIMSNRGNMPTAVVSSNDIMAIGAINCALTKGIAIPNDVSIIGFDNIDQCDYAKPRLTSVNVNANIMANAICLHLIQGIEHKARLKYKIVIPTELVLRDSIARI